MIIRHSSSTTTNDNINTNSVQSRIERSRLSRPLLRNLNNNNSSNNNTNLIQSNLPLYLARLALDDSTNTVEVPVNVGPPPPASWTLNDKSNSNRKVNRNYDRKKLLSSSNSVQSLGDIVGKAIICDLFQSAKHSMYLNLVHYLPRHLRLRLVDLASSSRVGLNENGVPALLLEEDTAEFESISRNEGVEKELESDTEEGGWEDTDFDSNDSLSTTLYISLTTLNLGHSVVTSIFLTSFLLTPSSRRSIPTFPHLTTLLLPSTDNISLNDSTFHDLLSHLLSLRHLSLSDKNLPLQQSHLCLIRIANSTPTLTSIDLSNCKNFDPASLGKIDWTTNWLKLRRLILIIPVEGKGEEAKVLETSLREIIYIKMAKSRRWIDLK